MQPGPMVLFVPMLTDGSTKFSYLLIFRPFRCAASPGCDDATSRLTSSNAGTVVSTLAQYASSGARCAQHGPPSGVWSVVTERFGGRCVSPSFPPVVVATPKTASMSPASPEVSEVLEGSADPPTPTPRNCLRTSAGTTSSCSEVMCGLASSKARTVGLSSTYSCASRRSVCTTRSRSRRSMGRLSLSTLSTSSSSAMRRSLSLARPT
mmetsp:Transcript_5475/g.20568  ORF Transcript_5475/g.20568 Transcript_5475/m.20568 type:complete len:208 (-) Transcript_5475:515-1138(-)